MKPARRDSRLKPGSGLTWFFEDRCGPAPRFASMRNPLVVSEVPSMSIKATSWRQLGNGAIKVTAARKRVGVISAALLTWALSALGISGSASAKLTGEFTRFQFCPYGNSEIKRSIHTVTMSDMGQRQGTFNRQVRELFKELFAGLNCYVGSIIKTVRGPISHTDMNQTDLELLNRFNSITANPRAIESTQIGIQLATTRTNALSSLTFSPA